MKKIKKNQKNFLSNKFLLLVILFGFLLNLSAWLVLWLGLDLNKITLVVHYNSFFGIDKISLQPEGKRFVKVFFAPLSGLLFMLINYFLGLVLIFSSWKKNKNNSLENKSIEKISTASLGGHFILLSGVVLQIMILVYTISIVIVN